MSMLDQEMADRRRDRRLRRRLLNTLNLAGHTSPRRGLSGRSLADLVEGVMGDAGQGFEDDGHALRLMREMVAKGLFAEELLPRRKVQRFGLDHVFYRITAAGVALFSESAPVDPDIDDERVAAGD